MNNLNLKLNCYTFVEYNFNEGLFDKTIDATYIIHLENNGRFESVIKQLEEYKPTKKVYILFNKGYNCKKEILGCKNKNLNVIYDLIHSNLTIMEHSNKNNYNNILVLEDDFIFNKKIKNKDIIDDINNFIYENNNLNFLYYIGGLPIFSIPVKRNHYKPIFIATLHSCIFSRKAREYLLINKKNIYETENHLDMYLSVNFNINRYHYKYPLCYQIFPNTNSQNQWKFSKNKTKNKIIKFLFLKSIKLIKLDTQYEPGFSIIYSFSKLLFLFFIIIIIYFFKKLK
jgi:hypothetical protein